ncbi:MAG: hypothetical protein GY749_09090 [Desulfobacteraceae bacterium]|nr:hypothetical protein [Desulfobacteraceae bacterium]
MTIFFSILGVFLFCLLYFPVRWLQNRQQYKLIIDFKSHFGLKDTIVSITEEKLIAFAKLNQSEKAYDYRYHLNAIWKTFHIQLISTLKDQSNVSQERLIHLEDLKRFASTLPAEKPDGWMQNWWPSDKYRSLLVPEIDFVKSLQPINKDSLTEQLKAIHSLLQTDNIANIFDDPLRARKCMARKATESVLKEDNDLTMDILKTMLDIEKHDGIPLSFSEVYKRLQKCGTEIKDYRLFQYEVQNKFKDILKQSEDRAFMLKKVLNEIVSVKSYSKKHEILKLIVKTVKDNSLFELSRREWPSGVKGEPLAKVLERHLKKNEPAWAIIRKFTSEPVYLSELQAVSSLVNSRYYQYEVIETLKDYIKQMKANAKVDLPELDRLKKIISELEYYEKEYLMKKRPSFGNEKATLKILKLLLTRWNHETKFKDNSYELGKMRKRIEGYLIRYCKKTKKPRDGDCYGVEYSQKKL